MGKYFMIRGTLTKPLNLTRYSFHSLHIITLQPSLLFSHSLHFISTSNHEEKKKNKSWAIRTIAFSVELALVKKCKESVWLAGGWQNASIKFDSSILSRWLTVLKKIWRSTEEEYERHKRREKKLNFIVVERQCDSQYTRAVRGPWSDSCTLLIRLYHRRKNKGRKKREKKNEKKTTREKEERGWDVCTYQNSDELTLLVLPIRRHFWMMCWWHLSGVINVVMMTSVRFVYCLLFIHFTSALYLTESI